MDSKNRLSLGSDVVNNIGRQFHIEVVGDCILLRPIKDKNLVITRGRKRKQPLPGKK